MVYTHAAERQMNLAEPATASDLQRYQPIELVQAKTPLSREKEPAAAADVSAIPLRQ